MQGPKINEELDSPLLKIGDAANKLGVSIKTLRRWEEAGKLPAVKTPGGTRYYSLDDLAKFNPKLGRKHLKKAPSLQKTPAAARTLILT